VLMLMTGALSLTSLRTG